MVGKLPESLKQKLDALRKQIAEEIRKGYAATARALGGEYERLIDDQTR